VGGNRLLPPHAALTTVQLCDGQGVLMADAARVADLEQQLVALGPHLAALAVALKAQVLPAMPWLDAQLPCECAELAESVGAAASQLLELGCLVGQQCMLRPGAQAAAAASVSRQAAAAATAGQWGHQEASAPAQAPGQLPTVAQEALSQLSSCIEAAVAEAREAGCSKRPQPGGASSIGRTSGGGGGGGTAPAQQHVAAVLHQLAASQRLLRQLGLHCRMAAAKQALLHEQLQFAATATAAQARLAGGLVNEVAGAIQSCTGGGGDLGCRSTALGTSSNAQLLGVARAWFSMLAWLMSTRAAADTEAADELRQRELRAAVAHLLKGMQLMERHPGQPALLALLDVLDKHRDVLAALPEVCARPTSQRCWCQGGCCFAALVCSARLCGPPAACRRLQALERASAPAVQAAALTAVQAAFKRYSDRLHEGQQRTHQVARRLKESVLGMQEQLQSGHGGGAAVARGAAAPPSSWALHTNTGTCPLLARE
jgi:hypothetical protein